MPENPDTYVNDSLSWVKPCGGCGRQIKRYRGQQTVLCTHCGTEHNPFGQALRSGWRDNPSNYDDEVSDLDGYETALLRREEF